MTKSTFAILLDYLDVAFFPWWHPMKGRKRPIKTRGLEKVTFLLGVDIHFVMILIFMTASTELASFKNFLQRLIFAKKKTKKYLIWLFRSIQQHSGRCLYSSLEYKGKVPFSRNNRCLLSWTMRAGFLIDAQWRVDSSGSSWLSAITSLMRSGTGNAAIVLPHRLSTTLDRPSIRESRI